MRIVVALGRQRAAAPGRADDRRGSAHQRARVACKSLAPVAEEHELVISHGNGPQVGLLALQAAAYDEVSAYPFDVLGAQTEGMIGYLIEQELGNLLPAGQAAGDHADDDPGRRGRPRVRASRPSSSARSTPRPTSPRSSPPAAAGSFRPGRRHVASGGALAAAAADRRDPAGRVAARPGHASSSAPAAAGSRRCTRTGTARSSASRRSSTRTAPAPSSPRTCTPTCWSSPPTSTRSTSDWGTPRSGRSSSAHPDALRPGALPGRVDGTQGRGRRAVRPRVRASGRHRVPRATVRHARRRRRHKDLGPGRGDGDPMSASTDPRASATAPAAHRIPVPRAVVDDGSRRGCDPSTRSCWTSARTSAG